jgi:hypothetical protein
MPVLRWPVVSGRYFPKLRDAKILLETLDSYGKTIHDGRMLISAKYYSVVQFYDAIKFWLIPCQELIQEDIFLA